MNRSLFDLAAVPCVPVDWRSGHSDGSAPADRPAMLSFPDVLVHAHELAGLAISDPPAHAALLRILYALTARSTALDEAGPGDWGDRRYEVMEAGRLPEAGIRAYFNRYRDRFFLYGREGDRPWMQDPRLATQCDTSAGINKLVVTRASGNNHAWFRHDQDASPQPLDSAQALLHLLVWQYYGPSGRCSSREVNGKKTANMRAGTLRGSLSYHPEGPTLFDTLLAGLPTPEAVVRREVDLCPWERDELPDPDALPPVHTGPCSTLTAVSQHALLLVPGDESGSTTKDAYITWAYRDGKISSEDFYLIWQLSQEGNLGPRLARASRALWRDLDALLLKEPDSARVRRPAIFSSAHEVAVEFDLGIRALGFEQDRTQAKDMQFVDASTPPVLQLLEERSPHTVQGIKQLRTVAETYGKRLDRAITRAWVAYKDDEKAKADTWKAAAAALYWPRAEAEFWHRIALLEKAQGQYDLGEVRKAFLSLALDSYETVTGPATRTARGAKAVVNSRIEIFGGRRTRKDGK